MSCFVMSFQTQLASVMDILVKAAISEVTKIVEGSLAGLQAEIDDRKKENESLKLKLLVKETEWRTERAYGSIGGAHVAGRRSVAVQVHDEEMRTGGGELAAEEGFLGEDWTCSLWKSGDVAKRESRSHFALDRTELDRTELNRSELDCTELNRSELNRSELDRSELDRTELDCTELDCIVIKEESADLEEQAMGCVSQQEESHRFARKGAGALQAAVEGGVAGRGSQTQCSALQWGLGGGACAGSEVMCEPQESRLQQEDPALGAELGTELDFVVGGAWQCEPAHLMPPPAGRGAWAGTHTHTHTHNTHTHTLGPQCGEGFHSEPAAPPSSSPPSVAPGDGPPRCTLCAKSFSSAWSLKTHQRLHSGEKPHSCSVCTRSFHSLDNLRTHQLVHTGERPFGCPLCGKRFGLQRNLKTHERTHTGEKPYSCSQCGRTFGHLQSLETHQRIHTGEKPYSCTHCGKNFSIAQNLKTHTRIHTGEKPYCCTQCGKCFSQLGNLRTHQRTHTGERPYCCTQCGKSFSLLQNLKTHQRIHSGNRAQPTGQDGP